MQWPYGVKPLILLRLTLADCHEISSAPGGWTSSTAPAGKCPKTRGLQGARTRPWRCRRPVAPRTGRIALKPILHVQVVTRRGFNHIQERTHERARTRAGGQRKLLAGQAGPTARRAAMPVASRAGAMRNLSVTCLRDPSNPHGAGAFRLSIRSVASLLEVGKLSAIEVKHEKPKGG